MTVHLSLEALSDFDNRPRPDVPLCGAEGETTRSGTADCVRCWEVYDEEARRRMRLEEDAKREFGLKGLAELQNAARMAGFTP